MTEQCAIYLDPWDKDDLEGTAMLIGRMPDITDRIYRGVTCQRWFVRFVPDQAIVFRWLDYGDAEPYVFPVADSNLYALSLSTLVRNDASTYYDWFKAGEVLAEWQAASKVASFITPRAGRLAGVDISYIIAAATGGASLSRISIRRNEVSAMSFTLTNSTTVGGPWAHSWHTETIKAYAKADRLTIALYTTQPAGEEVTFTDMLATIEMHWGDFT